MTNITVVTWNVNSVKSRLQHVLDFLREHSPDVVLLQELKCQTDAFPYMEIEDAGYNVAVHGQKTYNGVAILSKTPLDDIITDLPGSPCPEQARYIEAVVSLPGCAIRVASIYVPNGQDEGSEKFPMKLAFLEALHAHAQHLLSYEEAMVLGGDYNVAPEAIDVYAPKELEGTICFHPEERKRFRALIHNGLTDAYRSLHPHVAQYSWWDYRGSSLMHNKGMRIDHLLLSPEAADMLVASDVDMAGREKEKASDHAAVSCTLKL